MHRELLQALGLNVQVLPTKSIPKSASKKRKLSAINPLAKSEGENPPHKSARSSEDDTLSVRRSSRSRSVVDYSSTSFTNHRLAKDLGVQPSGRTDGYDRCVSCAIPVADKVK